MKLLLGVIAAVIGLTVVIGVAVSASGLSPVSPAASTANAQQDVIDTCQNAVKKDLKDPDSARFDGWTASQEATGSQYTASGMVNAKNAFGGYAGDEPYTCDAEVSDHTVRAQAHPG